MKMSIWTTFHGDAVVVEIFQFRLNPQTSTIILKSQKLNSKFRFADFLLFLSYLINKFPPPQVDLMTPENHSIQQYQQKCCFLLLVTLQPVLFQPFWGLRASCSSSVSQFLLAFLGTIEQVTILTVIYAFSSLSLSPLGWDWTELSTNLEQYTHTITDYYCNYYHIIIIITP